MAQVRAYIDDTGADADSTALGGFVAAAETWQGVERSWTAKLDEYAIDSFDIAECADGAGAFARWRGEPETRMRIAREFWGPLSGIARSGTAPIEGFWYATRREEWDWVAKSDFGRRHESPYRFLLATCLRQLGGWSARHAAGAPVSLILPEGGGNGEARGALPSRHGFLFASTRGVPLLQAANMLTVSMNRRMERVGLGLGADSNASRIYRGAAEGFLFPTKIALGGYYDGETLQTFAECDRERSAARID